MSKLRKGEFMAKTRYYAIRRGKKTGIFQAPWSEVQKLISGYPGAEYKGFDTKADAEKFLKGESGRNLAGKNINEINQEINTSLRDLAESSTMIFTDGSFNKRTNVAGWGMVALYKQDGQIKKIHANGPIKNIKHVETRNVIGELKAAGHAVNWALEHGYQKVTIYHDYLGVSAWPTGTWKAKLPLTQKYAQFIQDRQKEIKIEFVHVPAHTNITYNEEVDKVAKEGAGVL